MSQSYSDKDAGCYVDGAEGIYATDSIVDYVRANGATIERNCGCDHTMSCFESEFASCEYIGDYEDEAADCMNKHYPVPRHYWRRNEFGDWGLWEEEI